jgi:tRNA dimethylallyltransferase
MPHTPSFIALTGPTACGKTAAALAIATHYPVEIISVDSALVYRGMDIGTAKPSPAELARVRHHLINIRDPLQAYSAMEFVRDASSLINEITGRGKLPLLVGGTMLYLKALAEGLDDMPAANAEIRAALEQEAIQRGWPAMHAQLAGIDPITAARLAPADSQRIQRALEVYRISGKPLSTFHAEKAQRLAARSTDPVARTSALISLEPGDRTWLHERIAQRFDAMLQAGFMGEMRALRARGDLNPDLPSMRCVGYRQAWEALDGLWPMEQLRDKGIFATRQLAKRQMTWLRSMPQRIVVDAQHPDAQKLVVEQVKALLP